MGCCGDKIMQNSTTDFLMDLYILENYNNKAISFIIKKLDSQKFEKVIEKTLKDHLKESKLLKNPALGEKFEFSISNSLFYCYLNENPIVKNYLQLKDLEPFNFETLFKISILITKNYDKLLLPKINLINKTKFSSDLTDLKVDFSNMNANNQKIFDPNLSNDELMLTKPHLTEDLSEIHEEEDENNSNDHIEQKESENNESEGSVYEDEGEEDMNENQNDIEHNTKNYIHLKGEITPDVVRDVFRKLSPYINEDEEEDEEENNKFESSKNKEIIRRFRKSKSSIISKMDQDEIVKHGKSGIVIAEENIMAKKGKELKLNLNENDEEEKKITEPNKSINKANDPKNIIIDSVFIEDIKNLDLEIFSELIEILSIYPRLKRISFCDLHLDKEFEGWENIIHLINENISIRWIDLHKSNMSNYVLELICKVIESKRIRYIDISENFINQEGAKILGNFLRKNKTLQRLILNNNDLEDFKKNGVNSICEALILHPNIQYLDFSSMSVTGCGESVANLIKTTKSLKTLILRDCLLNLRDFQFICRALASENISKTINNVDFSHNDMASDKSLEEIGKMVKVNKTLTHLNMEKMNLNMKNYNLIFNGLNENNNIAHFSFCFNPNIKPRIVLEYFLHRKKLSSLAYIPYKANINEKGPKVEFNLEERKIIEKFKKKRKRVKLITK